MTISITLPDEYVEFMDSVRRVSREDYVLASVLLRLLKALR